MAALGLAMFCAPSKAADIAPVTVSTLAITDSATLAAQISGKHTIDKLVLVNSSTTATVVTVYKNCGSTTTVAAVLKVLVPGTGAGGMAVVDFTASVVNNPFMYTDVCFRKADVVDYIYASAHYR